MENDNNNNDNLGDFLRGKFSGMDASDESWAKPDSNVRAQVLEQIFAANEPTSKRKKWLPIILLAGLFLLLLIYIGSLHHTIYQLKTTASTELTTSKTGITATTTTNSTQNKASENLTSETATLLTKASKENKKEGTTTNKEDLLTSYTTLQSKNAQLIAQKENLEETVQAQTVAIAQLKEQQALPVTNNSTNRTKKAIEKDLNAQKSKFLSIQNDWEKEKIAFKKTDKEQQQLITQLEADKALLQEQLDHDHSTAILATKETDTETIKANVLSYETIAPLVVDSLESDVLINNTAAMLVETLPTKAFLLENNKKKIGFEIGYEFALEGLLTEVARDMGPDHLHHDDMEKTVFLSHSHGIHVAISPIKKFWIRTGFHVGFSNIQQRFKSGMVYDQSADYIDAAGDRVHDLSVHSNSVYTSSRSDLSLMIPQTTTNKDMLAIDLKNDLELIRYQIPIGIEYHHGAKRLQGVFQLGGQWNLLNYKYSLSALSIASGTGEMDFKEQTNNSATGMSKTSYLSIYGGAGLNYQLSKNWNVRGLISYEYNFVNNELRSFSEGSKMGIGLNLSLNYRF